MNKLPISCKSVRQSISPNFIEWLARYCRFKVIVLAIFFSHLTLGQTSSVSSGSSEALGNVDEKKLIGLLQDFRNGIDRSQFELDALLESSDYEAEKIISFINERIQFEQYAGAMKGARGTLTSRAGNAVDQSILLATLLKDAGYDARIHRGRLTPELANDLLNAMRRPRSPVSLFTAPVVSRNLWSEIQTVLKINSDDLAAESNNSSSDEPSFFSEYLLHKNLIERSLERSKFTFDSRSIEQAIYEEARDYYWVEYRATAANVWTPVHPAFDGYSPTDIDEVEVFSDEIPSRLLQRLRLSAKIVQKTGNEEVIHNLFDPWEQPVANLVGSNLTYANVSTRNWTRQSELALQSADPLFFPEINGAIPKNAKVFDTRGNLLPIEAAASFMAGIVLTTGNKLLGAAEALDGITHSGAQEDASLMRMSGFKIEVSLILPTSKESKTIARYLIRETERTKIAELAHQRVEMGISVGSPSRGEMLDNAIVSIIETLSSASSSKSGQFNRPDVQPESSIFFDLVASINDLVDSTKSYYSAPAIFARHHNTLIEDRSYTGFDILSNSRRSFSFDENGTFYNAELTSAYGVWETVIESWIGEEVLAPRSYDIIIALAPRVNDRSVGLTTVANGPEGSKPKILGDGISAQIMDADINAGFTILIPESPFSEKDQTTVWWRVHGHSGQTVGRAGPVGWGATLAETEALLDMNEWASCVMNVYARCTESVGWGFATVYGLAMIAEAQIDPTPKDETWIDWLKRNKENPIAMKLMAIMKEKTGVDIDKITDPNEYIQRCTVRNSYKPKEQGGCGDAPEWPQ